MYPQKTYGGRAETQVLDDGRVKYDIYLEGSDKPNTIVVDPANENEMRGVRQLHLVMRQGTQEGGPTTYIIDGDGVGHVLMHIAKMFKLIK